MLQQLLAAVLPLILWGAVSGVLNLILTRKSQIEAWVSVHPNLAAWSKFLRSVGFDPWAFHAWLTLLVAKKLPEYQQANSAIAKLEQRKADEKRLGGPPAGGAGGVRVTGLSDPEPTRTGQPLPRDFELQSIPDRESRAHGLLIALPCELLLLLVGCSSVQPPCDESKLRAADERYVARVVATCLAKYDKASDCPAFPGLQAEHRRELREVCP